MENSRTRNSVYNIASSIGIRVLTLILSFASRTIFIYVLGAVYLGLQGLFSNVLSFLALSELGIGAAISFLLYKPLAVNDIERIKTVMQFYKKCYLVVGAVIIALGCCLMPFLHYLVNVDQPIPDNLYLIFFLFVLNSAVSYFFVAYKQTMIEANQKKYLLTKLEVAFTIINCIVDIIVLLIFRDFIAYLLFKLLLVIIRNLVLAKKIDNLYPYLKDPVEKTLSKMEVRKIFKDVYSVSVFRLGSVLFNSVTNIVTSAVVGTIVVGYYSNYMLIVCQIEVIFNMTITAVSAGIGNLVATENMQKQFHVYKELNLLSFLFYGTVTVCLFQLLNPFMNIWLGGVDESYILDQTIVILICVNFYINCSCQILERFKNAKGLFVLGRDLQVIGGLLNIVLSVILAKWLGFKGVLLSPVLCKLFVTVTPYIVRVGKYSFGRSSFDMLYEFFSQIGVVAIIACVVNFACGRFDDRGVFPFLLELIVALLLSVIGTCLFYHRTSAFKELYCKYIKTRNR